MEFADELNQHRQGGPPMAYDLVIRNGTVVDGTGAPGKRADVAVSDGRIAEIGRVEDGADEIMDAGDCVVAPGFIDPHTHYDAQICWDGAVTPSSWHGVTSVVMGNCGVGIAPCLPEAREIAMRDLVNVEGIPFDVLDKGITWDWETFPEFMDAADARQPSVNLAFLAPLTPFRHYVMGEESMERAATPEEAGRIAGLLGEAVDAGAFGFSTTILNQHVGYEGRPLACRNADDAELTVYARVLRERDKGTIEIAATKRIGIIDDDQYALLDMLLTESDRPVTFLGLVDRDDIPNAAWNTLEKTAPLLERGVRPQILPLPLTREFNMRNPFSFAAFPSWNRVFVDKSKEGQRAAYADREFRNAFRGEMLKQLNFCDFNRITLHEVKNPALKRLEGQTVTEIAKARGTDEVDAFLDVTLEDDVDNEFIFTSFNTEIDSMTRILNHPHVLIGLGDGGAHVDMLCDAGYPTFLLGKWVRERQAMTLERAVQKLTSEPADLFGIAERGRLREGNWADITIFDPENVGSPERNERSYDLPGGAKRMLRPSRGIECTIVNGKSIYRDGKLVEASSGRVLRS